MAFRYIVGKVFIVIGSDVEHVDIKFWVRLMESLELVQCVMIVTGLSSVSKITESWILRHTNKQQLRALT